MSWARVQMQRVRSLTVVRVMRLVSQKFENMELSLLCAIFVTNGKVLTRTGLEMPDCKIVSTTS